ncbi:hypothetical protein NP233_g7565 [Leucocoprinus birnbaumii]|uniref:SCP domain-containing protein n=1 Tax=Leucocoprinus birnbaumii TaxID=56174 RepID=A0AAD5VRM3_9AGAR|nr:hypothetical protein NP233_g7565 [Leucocoprinus birnbaumii]
MKFTLVSVLTFVALASAMPSKRDQFSDDALAAHNTNRANYGANPLTWNTAAASEAAAFTSNCTWGLDKSSGSRGFGQNIYSETGSDATVADGVASWMAQASDYNYDKPGFNSSTAAFTQVVWKSTTSVGCATKVCETGNPFEGFEGPWTFVACLYSPQGNIATEAQFRKNAQDSSKGFFPPSVIPALTTIMQLTFTHCLLALATCVAATPLKRDQFSDDALAAHNTNRANFGANPLTWNTAGASEAASFTSKNFGQNIYGATGGPDATVAEAVESWMAEAPEYNYDQPGFNVSTGAFTQVVWKSTTSVGCGLTVCTTGNPFGGFDGPWTFIACLYSPPGNNVAPGQFAANVGRPVNSN